MVIFIGGVSCSGKINMAQKIMEKHHIPYMSIDHIKMGLIRTGVSKYVNNGFDCGSNDAEITKEIWPIVREIAKTNIENNQHIIIEGCYIPADEVMHFETEYRDFVIPMYLVFSKEYIENHSEDGIFGNLCAIESKDMEGTRDYLTKEFLIREHGLQKTCCEENGAKYFEIKDDYEREIEEACRWVDKQIAEKRGLKYNE